MENVAVKQGGKAFAEVIKAVIIAVIVALLLMLLATFLIKILNISDTYIPIINQINKGVSILTGCLIAFKTRANGWIKGIFAGVLFILIAFVIFSLLGTGFKFGLNLLNDVAIGAVTGMVSGIISILIRRKRI